MPSIDAVARTSDDVDLPLPILTQFPPRDQPPIKFGLPLQRRPISAAAGRHAGDEEHPENGSTSVRPRRLYIGLGRPAGRRTEPRPPCSGTAVGLDAERCAEALPSHSLTVRRCGVRERQLSVGTKQNRFLSSASADCVYAVDLTTRRGWLTSPAGFRWRWREVNLNLTVSALVIINLTRPHLQCITTVRRVATAKISALVTVGFDDVRNNYHHYHRQFIEFNTHECSMK